MRSILYLQSFSPRLHPKSVHRLRHLLRHTHATLLISENNDIKMVAHRLGHSRTSTTVNVYSHALQRKDEKSAEVIGNLLIPGRKDNSIEVADSNSKV